MLITFSTNFSKLILSPKNPSFCLGISGISGVSIGDFTISAPREPKPTPPATGLDLISGGVIADFAVFVLIIFSTNFSKLILFFLFKNPSFI